MGALDVVATVVDGNDVAVVAVGAAAAVKCYRVVSGDGDDNGDGDGDDDDLAVAPVHVIDDGHNLAVASVNDVVVA